MKDGAHAVVEAHAVKRILGVHLPPDETPHTLWLRVLVWTAIVYASIPLARTIQAGVESSVGVVAFTAVTLVAIALGATAVVRVAWHARPEHRAFRLVALACITAVFAFLTLRLRDSPEEALHFVQYGILAVLVLRAVSARTESRNPSAYLSAAAVCVLIGAGDEVIQWLVPERFFDFRDIGLNAVAALGVLAAIRLGIDPEYLHATPGDSSAGWARASRLWAATGFVALLLFANTPSVVETYTAVLVPLRYLRTDSTMAEYGEAHRSGGITWKSRFSLDEAHRLEAERAVELADLAREVSRDEDAAEAMLAEHRRGTDPLAFELISRIRVVAEARDALADVRSRGVDGVVEPTEVSANLAGTAIGEAMILEEMFPRTLAISGSGLSAAEIQQFGQLALAAPSSEPGAATRSVEYESLMDNRLVTSPSQKWTIWLVVPLTVGLLLVDLLLRRRLRRDASGMHPQRTASKVSTT